MAYIKINTSSTMMTSSDMIETELAWLHLVFSDKPVAI